MIDPGSDDELNLDELSVAQSIINEAMPDTYTLRKLYGARWNAISSSTEFGGRFKCSVLRRRLKNIEVHPSKTGANAVQYRIKGR